MFRNHESFIVYTPQADQATTPLDADQLDTVEAAVLRALQAAPPSSETVAEHEAIEADPDAADLAQFEGFMKAALEATPLYRQLPEQVQEYIVAELTGLLKKELAVLRRPHANNLTPFIFTITYRAELKALKQRIYADIAQLSENPITASKLGGFITNTFKRFTRYIYLGEVLTDEQIKYRRSRIIRAVWHKSSDNRTTKTIGEPADPERDKTNRLY
jgi:hypothetical protein